MLYAYCLEAAHGSSGLRCPAVACHSGNSAEAHRLQPLVADAHHPVKANGLCSPVLSAVFADDLVDHLGFALALSFRSTVFPVVNNRLDI